MSNVHSVMTATTIRTCAHSSLIALTFFMDRTRRQAAQSAIRLMHGLSNDDESGVTDSNSSDDHEDDNDSVISNIDTDDMDDDTGSEIEESPVTESADGDGNTMRSKNGNETWHKHPFMYGNQAQSRNILREQPGPSRQAVRFCGISPASAFRLFITDEMCRLIMTHTNYEGRRLYQNWKEIDDNELRVFIGLLLLAGVYNSKNTPVEELWSSEDGRPIFNSSMSRDRFIQIRRSLRFDNRDTRNRNDKLAPIRQLFEMFITKCKSNYKPSPFITIDEQLVTFRGRCPFKMFIPTKPGKYGIKIWILCDSNNSYCCNAQIYLGRVGARDIGQSHRVVMELTDHICGTGRHLTADNFFTDITTIRTLLGRQITYTGTLRKNKGEIPIAMLANANRPVESSIFGFQRDVTLVSYVPKRNKAVILMSSFHHDESVEAENKHKPEIITDYNCHKGGVDTLDQLVRWYTCRRKSRRWPFILFCNILDIASYNAFVLFLSQHPNYKNGVSHRRRHFLIELAKSLLPEHTSASSLRTSQVYHLSSRSAERSTTGRCQFCPRSRDRKTPHVCHKCKKRVCKDHLKVYCGNCLDN